MKKNKRAVVRVTTDWNRKGSQEKKRRQRPGKDICIADIVYSKTRIVSPSLSLMEKYRVLPAQETGDITHAYELLRTQVLSRMHEQGWKVLGVTSPDRDSGKTLTAINLAISISRKIDTTVLLVDANLRNPEVDFYFGLDMNVGLIDYILNDMPIEKLLVHPRINRLTLLPAGKAVEKGSELLTSPKMLDLVKELKYRYTSRIVIFDLPSVLDSADTLAISPHLDSILLVLKSGSTKREEIVRTLQLLEKVPIIGTVLNQG